MESLGGKCYIEAIIPVNDKCSEDCELNDFISAKKTTRKSTPGANYCAGAAFGPIEYEKLPDEVKNKIEKYIESMRKKKKDASFDCRCSSLSYMDSSYNPRFYFDSEQSLLLFLEKNNCVIDDKIDIVKMYDSLVTSEDSSIINKPPIDALYRTHKFTGVSYWASDKKSFYVEGSQTIYPRRFVIKRDDEDITQEIIKKLNGSGITGTNWRDQQDAEKGLWPLPYHKSRRRT